MGDLPFIILFIQSFRFDLRYPYSIGETQRKRYFVPVFCDKYVGI